MIALEHLNYSLLITNECEILFLLKSEFQIIINGVILITLTFQVPLAAPFDHYILLFLGVSIPVTKVVLSF